MRGYVEKLERDHYYHEDNCGCEVDLADKSGRPGPDSAEFKAFLHKEYERIQNERGNDETEI